ncbi:MAG: monovalent cation/H(+) antiporter subunit G [Candidatus Omnitrophica bacterium]|nr:monovalent cation/H(+) antiporter subunit G [Candidatus Omnitrophota bacterium]
MNEYIGFAFIIIGALFDLFGCIGLVRLPDLYNRLQAATKCVTLGTCGMLFGAFIIFGFTVSGMKAFLCAVFVLVTSPTSAHALARASYVSGVKLWQGSVVDKLKEDIEKH